ncbi:uncharacterized protein LOC132265045 [Phlebotomus argentipes]|uniref:uncharacterized protein LOC132265045 n=1 Tax=Phlebotomus argentipes TaxID=94469 RepID=UPI0028936AC0|nr:uncharacterized protein LOC132265045 [Phlebotomus argentipes]
MKRLQVIIFVVTALIVICGAERPEKKCAREHKNEKSCIIPCAYTYYEFLDKQYRVTKRHVDNYRNFLLKYKAVQEDKLKDLENHLYDCLKISKSPEESSLVEKCEKARKFEHCIIDKNILNYPVYYNAFKKLNFVMDV